MIKHTSGMSCLGKVIKMKACIQLPSVILRVKTKVDDAFLFGNEVIATRASEECCVEVKSRLMMHSCLPNDADISLTVAFLIIS